MVPTHDLIIFEAGTYNYLVSLVSYTYNNLVSLIGYIYGDTSMEMSDTYIHENSGNELTAHASYRSCN